MLLCKDRRVYIQNEMIRKYKNTLICLTLNIPGEYKASEDIEKIYEIAKSRIKDSLKIENVDVIKEFEIKEHTGFEFYICADKDAIKIKNICMEIEDKDKLSRLFDIDIIDKDNKKIDRNGLNYQPRKCLICQNEAKGCARNRTHSLEELANEINKIIKEHIL